jgi:hypothetical protein
MKESIRVFLGILFLYLPACQALSLPAIEGKVFGLMPVTNEVSFYRNADDVGNDRGETIQIIAINSFKILTEFCFEFTADFNWDMSGQKRDHYMELSVVKPIARGISVNYQRIISSFENQPINQFGIRFSL